MATIHRFFLNPEDTFTSSTITINNPALLHQITKVLRLQPQALVTFLNSQTQTEYLAQITTLSRIKVKTTIKSEIQNLNEPQTKVNLYFALLKNSDKIELILQKCTELGISEFTPIITARTEKKQLPKIARLEKIIQEAAEQSQRITLPTLNPLQPLTDIFKNPPENTNYIGDLNSSNQLLSISTASNPQIYNLFIGPEGGFTQDELDQAFAQKFISFKLTKLTLRAETACIVASSKLLID